MAQTFGRPKSCINVNLNKIQNTVNEFQIFLSDEKDIYFEKKKEKVKCLIEELQKLVIESDDKQIQTDVKPLVKIFAHMSTIVKVSYYLFNCNTYIHSKIR